MTLTLSLNDEMSHLDGLEVVTLLPPGDATGQAITKALRRGPTRREMAASKGKYLAGDVKWHLPAAEVTAAPVPGAKIVDVAGESWTVLWVNRQTLGGRWCCWARNLAIAGGLDETITLQHAAWTRDLHGAPVALWSDFRTGLRARLQPQEGHVDRERDGRTTLAKYRVYLAEEVRVNESHRILHGDTVYHVLGYEMPERIDELFVILAERAATPWGTEGSAA